MVEFSKVADTNNRYFIEALKIYVNAFPLNERQSEATVRDRVSKGQNLLWIGHVNDELVFMALLWPLRNTGYAVLDYMATKASHQGQGIATAFMQRMEDDLRKKKASFILEVEDERQGHNIEERLRRKSFYRKNGAKELKNVRYVLPPLQGDTPTDMSLMIFPDYGAATIEIEHVKSLILQMYRELYGRDRDDPFLMSIMTDLKDPVELI